MHKTKALAPGDLKGMQPPLLTLEVEKVKMSAVKRVYWGKKAVFPYGVVVIAIRLALGLASVCIWKQEIKSGIPSM